MIDCTLLPLKTNHVTLRALEDRDAEAFAQGTTDPLVQEYGHLPEPNYTADSVRTMLREQVEPGLARGDLAVLAIADAQDTFAGSLVLFNVTDEAAEVGFWLHPDFRGAGMSGLAVELAAQLATRSGLNRLIARTAVENVASQQVLLKAGFQETTRSTGTTPSGATLELVSFERDLTSTIDPE